MDCDFQILPAILEKSRKDIDLKLYETSRFARWAQIDVVDGAFAPMLTWPYSANFIDSFLQRYRIKTKIKLELHLMAQYPIDFLNNYGNLGATRLIAHAESEQLDELILRWREFGFSEFGLSFMIDTTLEKYSKVKDLSCAQIMCIDKIGMQGSEFSYKATDKVALARKIFPRSTIIATDGGVKDDNITLLYKAGSRQFAVGSYIFKSNDPYARYKKLEKILENECAKI